MVKDAIKESFGAIWPGHVSNFVEHLIACRRTMGDLDLLLIVAVIGDRTMSRRRTESTASHTHLFVEKRDLPDPEPINVQSISDFTGIPRETVRRWVVELIGRGWVTKDEKGYLAMTPRTADDLAALTEHGIEYLAKMHQVLAALKTDVNS